MDRDISSSFIAFPAFVLHSMNSIRLATIVLFAAAGMPKLLRTRGSVIDPFIDLAMRMQILARGMDRGSEFADPQWDSSWHMVVSGIYDIGAWWEKHAKKDTRHKGGEIEVEIEVQVQVHILQCVQDLNAACEILLSGAASHVQTAYMSPEEWTFLTLVCSSLVSETARLMAAAGTIASSHLSDFPQEDNPQQLKAWRLSWDANMYTLRKVHAYATMTSVSQHEGIGRHEHDPDQVYIPTFDGTLAHQLLVAIDAIVAKEHAPHHHAFSLSGMQRLSSPIPTHSVPASAAFNFCRRGFLILLLRFGNLREAEQRLPLSQRMYMPLLRWDILVAATGLGVRCEKLHGSVDTAAEPRWTPIKILISEDPGADRPLNRCVAYDHGALHMSAHVVEFIRPLTLPYKAQTRDPKSSSSRTLRSTASREQPTQAPRFSGQVRTFIVNPATWGPLGIMKQGGNLAAE